MSYNILGIVPGHNGSACVLSDGKVVYFLEEERLSRYKRDGNPFRVINDILSKYRIDEVVLGGIGIQSFPLVHTSEDLYHGIVRKHYPNVIFKKIYNFHHLSHSSHSFFNSGFNKALSIVIDGNGSRHKFEVNSKIFEGDEIESIYIHEYPFKYYQYSKVLLNPLLKNITHDEKNNSITNIIGIGKAYEAISEYLGLGRDEGGKTMGLSSYGKTNLNIPSLLKNQSIFKYDSSRDDIYFIDIKKNILDNYLPEDLAYKIQQESQQVVGDYIEEAIKKTGLKQVCCAGGYFLNCVANYYLVKRFPDVEFYFEPVAHDAGTAIGAAKLIWHERTQDKTIRPQKSLYYGPKYSKKQLLKRIKKYVSN